MRVWLAGALLLQLAAARISNPGTWDQLQPNSPPGSSVNAAAGTLGGQAYLVAADAGATATSIYRFNPVANNGQGVYVNLQHTLPGSAASADIEVIAGWVNVFGGKNSSYTSDHYVIAPESSMPEWKKVNVATFPSPRAGHTITQLGPMLYLVGGWDSSQYYSEVWEIDSTYFHDESAITPGWAKVNTKGGPAARNSHTAVTYGSNLYIFGGFSHNVAAGTEVHCTLLAEQCLWFNDMWRFNPVSHVWSQVAYVNAPPSRRSGHSAVVIGHRMYVFGGQANPVVNPGGLPTFGVVNDLWSFDFLTGAWHSHDLPMRPVARQEHTAFVIANNMYIFGGRGNNRMVDTWRYTPGVASPVPAAHGQQEADTTNARNAVIFTIFFTLSILFFHVWQYRKTLSSGAAAPASTGPAPNAGNVNY